MTRKTGWIQYLTKQLKKFYPIFITDVFGLVKLFWLDVGVKWLKVRVTAFTQYLTKPWRKFHPILVTGVFGVVDVLIRCWIKNQMSRSQQLMTRKTGWIQHFRKYVSCFLTNYFAYVPGRPGTCWLSRNVNSMSEWVTECDSLCVPKHFTWLTVLLKGVFVFVYLCLV